MNNSLYQKPASIKSWAEDDRPREKLMNKGHSALSDAELLAILLGSGSRNESAVDLAKRILAKAENNLSQLGKMTLADLKAFKGVGEAKAITIMAAMELGRRRKQADRLEREKISGSKDVFEIMEPQLADLPHEEFWIILLNRSNKIIRKECISRGGITGTVADLRLIFKPAIESLATGIIVCHNHPSGNLKPSDADVSLTRKIRDAGALLDIHLLDHLIIVEKAYYSFADEGRL
jgi:DNA repair protein RadC